MFINIESMSVRKMHEVLPREKGLNRAPVVVQVQLVTTLDELRSGLS